MKVFTLFLIWVTLALTANGVPAPMGPFPPIGRSGHNPFANATRLPCTTIDRLRIGKNGLIDPDYRWTDFNVQLDSNFDDKEQQLINEAMYNLQQVLTCINFGIWGPNQTPTGDYVYIIKGSNNGCNSWIGRLRQGRQDMNLESPGCMDVATIMHEMIHALGLHHEHCRPDRDDFVNIHWNNIIPDQQFNFNKYSSDEVSTFGVEYNYQSIMHYQTYDFSKNTKETITTKTGGVVGSDDILHDSDKRKLKLMYNCN